MKGSENLREFSGFFAGTGRAAAQVVWLKDFARLRRRGDGADIEYPVLSTQCSA
jgi:hypothetical protein